MKVLIVLCFVAGAFASCPANSHYESCGTACPLTCENYKNPPRFCVLMCNPGCHCDEGYVKTQDGRCVLPEQCETQAPAECGANERYNECGTACPLTCNNYKNPPKICTLQCVIGCECEKGYVKSTDGRCILPENCPTQVCGANEQYTECGTACPLTCDNYNDPPKPCTLQCVIGCECAKGFVRSANGRCVKPENCPAKKNCVDKPETGMCRGYFPSWNFDAKSGTCQKFIYGGCQGNGNRYGSEEECMKKCADAKLEQSSNAFCDMPPSTGLCRGHMLRYHFDKASGQCKKFIYGGCGGNENNFKSPDECHSSCGGVQKALERPDCDKAPETGNCRAFNRRFYYDQDAGMCLTFVYGGCGGNKNNFETVEECYNRCGALAAVPNSECEQEKVVGPCRAAFPRYFYNKETKQCEKFIYGGCRGNDNNFISKSDCESTCLA